jgi:hypothetical protein
MAADITSRLIERPPGPDPKDFSVSEYVRLPEGD